MNLEYQLSAFYKFRIFKVSKIFALFILLITLALSSYANAMYAFAEDASLETIEGTSFSSFKIADGIAFPASRKIYIEAVEASFSRDWMREFRSKTSRRYRDKTLQKYAETIRTQIGEKLASAGWIVLSRPEDGAMKIIAKLVDIHITSPETLNSVNPLVLNIGRSGLELSILDANNKLALYVKDSRAAGSPTESYIETNRAMNFTRFNKMFYGWANDLTVYLNIISGLS